MAKIEDNTPQTIRTLEQAIKGALEEIGKTGRVDLMANCVVGKNTPAPGTLRKGHNYKVNGVKSVTFGNSVEYAPYVEFKSPSRGGRPWFRKTIEADKGKFQQIITKYIKKVES